MDCVFCPLGVHTLPLALLDVRVTLPPEQNVVGPPAVAVGVGLEFTVTVVADDVAEHPEPFVTVTL